MAAHTGEHGAETENAICRTLADLQLQDIVRQQLEGVIGAYDNLDVAIGIAVAAVRDADDASQPDPAAVEGLIAQMHDRYVMAQQRAVHAGAFGGTAGFTGDAGAVAATELSEAPGGRRIRLIRALVDGP